MKIGSTTSNLVQAGKPAENRPAAQDAEATEGAAALVKGKDSVSLSDLSLKLSAMESRIGEGGVDSARVSAIKSAIRSGQFKVDAGAVADRLLQNVQDMLGKKG